VYESGGLYGYKHGGDMAIPAQFDRAGDFHDGYAPVVKDGRSGIIACKDGLTRVLVEQDGDRLSCHVDYPASVEAGKYEVVATADGQDTKPVVEADTAERRLTCDLSALSGAKAIDITVLHDGMVVKTLRHEKPAEQADGKRAAGSVYVASFGKQTRRADANDMERIAATIVNNTATTQTVRCTIYVDGVPYAQSLRIRPRRSATATARIKVKKERYARVYVRLSGGYATKAKSIQLKPFY